MTAAQESRDVSADAARDAVVRLLGQDTGDLTRLSPAGADPSIHRSRTVVVYIAESDATRSRLAREKRWLAWAMDAGLPVPSVLAVDPSTLVVQRVAATGELTGAAVEALVVAMSLLRQPPTSPPAEDLGSLDDGGRSPLERVRSIAALRRHGVSIRDVVASSRAVDELPRVVVGHGDLDPTNVLVDAASGAIHLVDFELAGPTADGADLAHVWPWLAAAQDRARIESVLDDWVGADMSLILRRRAAIEHISALLDDDVTGKPLERARARYDECRRLPS